MIAVLTHNYPTPDNPTAGVFILDHLKQVRARHNTDVIVYNHPFGEYPMTVSVTKPHKWPKLLLYFVRMLLRIRQEVTGADMVIAHWWIPSGVFAAMFHRNVEVICHGTDLYWLDKHRWAGALFRPLAKRVAGWQCVSEDLKQLLLKLYPFLQADAVRIDPMPVSDDFHQMDIPRRQDLVVSVGSLIPRKNFDLLIQAVAETPAVHLGIYGDGPQREPLQALIDRLNVGDRVTLWGAVPRKELCRVFNEAALFALVSDDEGFGMVLKEAQACGCKTMAFGIQGMVDTGIDYPLGRDDSISDRIQQILGQGVSG